MCSVKRSVALRTARGSNRKSFPVELDQIEGIEEYIGVMVPVPDPVE
jgi:hypothetical protein